MIERKIPGVGEHRGVRPIALEATLASASLRSRLGAAFIDVGVVLAFRLALALPMLSIPAYRSYYLQYVLAVGEAGGPGSLLSLVVAFLELGFPVAALLELGIPLALYSSALLGTRGQTLGMRAMQIRVIVPGKAQIGIGFLRSLLRFVAALLSTLPAMIGFLPMVRDPQRRAFHDVVTGTTVVWDRVAVTPGEVMQGLTRRFEAIQASLHALKNNVTLLPVADTDEARWNAILSCFAPATVDAVNANLEDALSQLSALRRIQASSLGLLPESGAPARMYRRTLTDLVAASSRLKEHGAQFQRTANDLRNISPEARQEFVGRAATELADFGGWLANSERTGMLDVVTQTLETASLRGTLRVAVREVKAHANAGGITIAIAPGISPTLHVPGDPGLLQRTVATLLENAIEAIRRRSDRPPDYQGLVEVTVHEDRQAAMVEIRDNGCGFSADRLARALRGERQSTKGASGGLGLPTARRTIGQYPGGELEIFSDGENQGATVTVRFDRVSG